MVAQFAPPVTAAEPAIGAIVPHGSYQHSGAIVGQTLGRVAIPERCLILGSNHTGVGSPWSVMSDGAYQTPIGEVPIDQTLARALLEACPLLEDEAIAHHGEHAIEVVLPFLQWLGPRSLSIVPIIVGSDEVDEYDQVATAIAHVLRQVGEPVLSVASSDFSQFEPRHVVTQKDAPLLRAIETLDVRSFLQGACHSSATICGLGPIACVLSAAQQVGATTGRIIRYGTSADGGGDPESVVGYAGILIT